MWVFGYGSLVWNPGFDTVERVTARLPGYRRSFCMRSIHHRGTPEAPGLVLALDRAPEAACSGLALRVDAAEADAVLEYLRARELISAAYHEARLPVALGDGREVEAVTYVVDADHAQYCGGLDLEEQAQIIARAHGGRGPNTEYLFQTDAHLRELGLGDRELDWLVRRVRDLCG
ncbi:gamma-glutamylcyclotransferase [Roseovarius ramblicola]|uniref:glutathione-specific gamma-glutamylcyclotransferase n=1 Tax=Roseovarius ramblicola TaxID=2022336 RepID=A0ABV5HZ28_9RHOB